MSATKSRAAYYQLVKDSFKGTTGANNIAILNSLHRPKSGVWCDLTIQMGGGIMPGLIPGMGWLIQLIGRPGAHFLIASAELRYAVIREYEPHDPEFPDNFRDWVLDLKNWKVGP